MGKRKSRKEDQQPTNSASENGEEGDEKGAGFFACYLLTSVCPRFKGHTYIGFTVNPRRRIRQHNGEIGCGAWRTKRKRPWEMVLCIYGFPTNVAALQFEWAWQHPVESLAVRSAAASFKSLSGLANKIKLAYTMLSLPPWQSLNLTVNLFSTKYQKHTSICPTLPDQMRTKICSMDDLPCYNDANDSPYDDDECEGLSHDSTEQEPSRRENDGLFPNSRDSCEENIHQETGSSGCLTKTGAEWSNNSPQIREEEEEEDHGQFFVVNDSPERTPFSYIAEKARKNPRLIELSTEFDEPLEKQPAATPFVAADKEEVLIMSPDIMSREVEIVDIFTPSPSYRVDSGRKKRKPNLFPEVIDLTNSPMYV